MKYEIRYDYCDEDGNETKDIVDEFDGTWIDLQDQIKLMKKGGCSNIEATNTSVEEYADTEGVL